MAASFIRRDNHVACWHVWFSCNVRNSVAIGRKADIWWTAHFGDELKGKNIGVLDFAGTEFSVTKNVLRNLGIDPERDVKWTAVGSGVAGAKRPFKQNKGIQDEATA